MFYTSKYVYFTNVIISSLTSVQPTNAWREIFIHGDTEEGVRMPVPWSIYTWRWRSWSCYMDPRRERWRHTIGGCWANSATGRTKGWHGRNLREVGKDCGYTPAGGRNDGRNTTGDGDLRFLPPEYGRTVHCDQAHFEPVYGGGSDTGANDIQVVVEVAWSRCGEYVDGGLGVETYGVGDL